MAAAWEDVGWPAPAVVAAAEAAVEWATAAEVGWAAAAGAELGWVVAAGVDVRWAAAAAEDDVAPIFYSSCCCWGWCGTIFFFRLLASTSWVVYASSHNSLQKYVGSYNIKATGTPKAYLIFLS